MVRPSEFKKEYIKKADLYLKKCQDEEVQVVRQSNSAKGYEMYDTKIKVKLPTIEGFAVFIGVSKQAMYRWEEEHDEFRNALNKIRQEQQERLINSGLSGDYNSTIAKLILSSNHGMRERTDHTTDDKEFSINQFTNEQLIAIAKNTIEGTSPDDNSTSKK